MLHHEFRIITKNKEVKKSRCIAPGPRTGAKPAVIGACPDIIARKQAEEERGKPISELREALERMLFVPHVRKYVMKRDPGSRQGCIYETTPKLISATGFVRTVQKILYPDYYKTMFPGDYKKK